MKNNKFTLLILGVVAVTGFWNDSPDLQILQKEIQRDVSML